MIFNKSDYQYENDQNTQQLYMSDLEFNPVHK